MDSLTQAALGAACAGLVAGRKTSVKLLFTGAVLGTLPDLDVLIDYGTDIGNITYHRSATHSLFVLTVFSAIVAWLLNKLHFTSSLSARRLWLLCWLALITHPLLDAQTVYGTQLLWPFTDAPPTSWAQLFIIDPLITVPLLIGVFLAKPFPRVNVVTACFCLGYMGLSVYFQQIASTKISNYLTQQHQSDESQKLKVSVSLPGILCWRGLAQETDGLRVMQYSIWLDQVTDDTLYIDDKQLMPQKFDQQELERFNWFTQGYMHWHREQDKQMVTDMRFGPPWKHPFTFYYQDGQLNQVEMQDRNGSVQHALERYRSCLYL